MVRILMAGPNSYRWAAYAEEFRKDGHAVVHTFNGLTCVEQLAKFRPHVLILEPNIPWGGGDGILDVLSSEPDWSSVRVILVTSGCDSSLLYRLSQHSVDDLLWQPVAPAVLRHRVHQLIGRHVNLISTST